jgi:hypothetical protein
VISSTGKECFKNIIREAYMVLHYYNSWSRSLLKKQEENLSLRFLADHYYVHKSPPLGHTLSQMISVHIFTSDFFKIHFNTILPVMPRSLPFKYTD